MSDSGPPVSGSRPKATSGLPSLQRARKDRGGNTAIWNWLIPLVGVVLLGWWRYDAHRTGQLRDGLLARQREVAKRLAPQWLPMRDKVEAWTRECAAADFKETPNPTLAATWDFRALPGLYLRLGKKRADTVESIRKAATASLHDGFSACLFTASNGSPVAGARCENTQDCAAGELCNEFNQCATPSQPYNLRLAYRATRVLDDAWLTELQATRGELQLRGAWSSFDSIEKYDLPIATELLAKAAYFLVVVDEPVEGSEPKATPEPNEEATEDRSIPDGPHWARVCLHRFDGAARVLALRKEASGDLRGAKPQSDATRLAQQRQANGCSLALEVREAIGAPAGGALPPK
ncbi:MAG: hypothetical protein FJ095_16220 [Deltaproteobacteria bacterium]|nr:hypothetical protein [Deltaproteobacteria bacterium]